jgi:hypothetical protein
MDEKRLTQLKKEFQPEGKDMKDYSNTIDKIVNSDQLIPHEAESIAEELIQSAPTGIRRDLFEHFSEEFRKRVARLKALNLLVPYFHIRGVSPRELFEEVVNGGACFGCEHMIPLDELREMKNKVGQYVFSVTENKIRYNDVRGQSHCKREGQEMIATRNMYEGCMSAIPPVREALDTIFGKTTWDGKGPVHDHAKNFDKLYEKCYLLFWELEYYHDAIAGDKEKIDDLETADEIIKRMAKAKQEFKGNPFYPIFGPEIRKIFERSEKVVNAKRKRFLALQKSSNK